MKMIEKAVAAIVAELQRQEPEHGGTYFVDADDVSRATIDGFFDLNGLARAVLQAMREPSEAMIAPVAEMIVSAANWGGADGPAPASEGNSYAVEAWQAMIDAALEEG